MIEFHELLLGMLAFVAGFGGFCVWFDGWIQRW
jgi:hypothetical protein